MKKILIIIVLMLFISADRVQAQLADTPWPMYHQGPQHRSQSPYDTSHIKPELKWKFDVGNGIESSPVIGPDGTIYVGIFKDRFYAFNPDGTVKWILERPGEEFRSTAAVRKDGTIYVGATFDHIELYNIMHDAKSEYGTPKVYALDPEDGSVKWEFITGGLYSGTYSAPLIGPDGTIFMGSGETRMKPGTVGGGRLWAINPDGTGKWDFYTDNAFYTTPAISEDGSTIYATCADYNIYALDADTGKEIWHFRSEGAFDGSPTIGEDGTIYAGSVDKNLYAFSPDGTVQWYFTADEIIEATPSIGQDGTIYVGTLDLGKDHNLYALTPDGDEKWRFEAGEGVYAMPAIGAEGTLYFGSYDGNLYAVTPEGKEKWRFETGGGIIGSPSIDKDGTIYFGSWDNHLYAIGGTASTKEDTSSPDTSNNLAIILFSLLIALVPIAVLIFLYIKRRKNKQKRDLA